MALQTTNKSADEIVPQQPMILERMARLGVGGWDLCHVFDLMASDLQNLVTYEQAGFFIYRPDHGALYVQAIHPLGGSSLVPGTIVAVDGPVMDLDTVRRATFVNMAAIWR